MKNSINKYHELGIIVDKLIKAKNDDKKCVKRTVLKKLILKEGDSDSALEKRLSRRLNEIKETYGNLYLLWYKDDGYRIIEKNTKVNYTKSDNSILIDTTDVHDEKLQKKIREIKDAIKNRSILQVTKYKEVSGEDESTFDFLPIDLKVEDYDPYVVAINDNGELKRIKLARALGDFIPRPLTYTNYFINNIKTNQSNVINLQAAGLSGYEYLCFIYSNQSRLQFDQDRKDKKELVFEYQQDIFGWVKSTNEPAYNVSLHLTNYSMNMMVRDFPQLLKLISTLNKSQQIKVGVYLFKYKINIEFFSIKPIGRLVTGLLNHVKLANGNTQQVKDLFCDFVDDTVIKVWKKNLN